MLKNIFFLLFLLSISTISRVKTTTFLNNKKVDSLQGLCCEEKVDPIIIPPVDPIFPTGPWTNDTWTETKMGFTVKDGIVTPTSPSLIRFFNSARTLAGTPVIDNSNPANNPANVQRVMRLFKQSDWDYLFPLADKVYTYQTFLQAVAKFPAFCNEKASWLNEDMDNLCKKEMITMWAHWAQETGAHFAGMNGIQEEARQALYYLNEMGCSDAAGTGCDYRSTCSGWIQSAFPCAAGKKYYGRGAKQVSYNFNYGPFSKVMFGDVKVLLNNPELISTQGWLAVASGFWFYMTPQSPKPSIHEVVTGFWVPNDADKAANFQRGFGTTINIINGGIECGSSQMPQAQNRVKYFQFFQNYMKVNVDASEVMDCSKQPGAFVAGGNGTVNSYWDSDWNNPNRCQLVSWQTAFAFLFPDSYVKCIQKNTLNMDVTAF